MCYNHQNDLIAVSMADLSLRVLNMKNSLKTVRVF